MVYVHTGGTEEVDDESIPGAAEWNTGIAYASDLYTRPYYSGGVSLSSVHLVSKAIFTGYRLKLLEAAIT